MISTIQKTAYSLELVSRTTLHDNKSLLNQKCSSAYSFLVIINANNAHEEFCMTPNNNYYMVRFEIFFLVLVESDRKILVCSSVLNNKCFYYTFVGTRNLSNSTFKKNICMQPYLINQHHKSNIQSTLQPYWCNYICHCVLNLISLRESSNRFVVWLLLISTCCEFWNAFFYSRCLVSTYSDVYTKAFETETINFLRTFRSNTSRNTLQNEFKFDPFYSFQFISDHVLYCSHRRVESV